MNKEKIPDVACDTCLGFPRFSMVSRDERFSINLTAVGSGSWALCILMRFNRKETVMHQRGLLLIRNPSKQTAQEKYSQEHIVLW